MGPEGAGKTHFLYQKRLLHGVEPDKPMTPTVGFNYEEIEVEGHNIINHGKDGKAVAGFWDVGAGEGGQQAYEAIRSGVKFQAVLIVIDITHEAKSVFGGVNLQPREKGFQK